MQEIRALQNGHHNPDGNLKKEIDFLIALENREQTMTEAYDLGWSITTLVTFWYANRLRNKTRELLVTVTVYNVGSWVLLFFHDLSIGHTAMGYTCELVIHMPCLSSSV
jgi:hypothetical protein